MSLASDLAARLSGAPAEQIAERLGIPPTQASGAIATALPLLLGTLGHNANQPQGAEHLMDALQDHRGQDLGGALQGALAGQGQGNAILGHVFGDRQPHAEQALGQATGLGQDKANLLLRWLAPLVMAYLAKHFFDARHGDAASSSTGTGQNTATPSTQALGDVLAGETQHAQQQHGGLLDAVLGGLGSQGGLGGLLKMGESMLGNRTPPP